MIFSTSGEPFLQETSDKIQNLNLPKINSIGVCEVPTDPEWWCGKPCEEKEPMIIIKFDDGKYVFITEWVSLQAHLGSGYWLDVPDSQGHWTVQKKIEKAKQGVFPTIVEGNGSVKDFQELEDLLKKYCEESI